MAETHPTDNQENETPRNEVSWPQIERDHNNNQTQSDSRPQASTSEIPPLSTIPDQGVSGKHRGLRPILVPTLIFPQTWDVVELEKRKAAHWQMPEYPDWSRRRLDISKNMDKSGKFR